MCQSLLSSCLFFFKQKTAYELRISDWSSDVGSSDLRSAAATDLPEAFMKVAGLSSQTGWPAMTTLQVSPNSFDSRPKRAPSRSARASTSQNPALCRVLRCSGPGVPSPTLSRRPGIRPTCAGGPVRGTPPPNPEDVGDG